MRLVFVNRFFHPDVSATSQLLTELSQHLARTGYEVHVVTSRQLYGDPGARLPELEVTGGVTVHRVWSTRFGRSRLAGRALDYLSFYAGAGKALMALLRARDVVVAETDPPLISVVAGWIARWRGARLMNWTQDIFPEIAERLGVGLLQGAAGTVLRRLRDRSVAFASLNIVLGERMERELARLCGPGARVRVIHNWSDGTLVYPIERGRNSLREEWGLGDRFVIGYSGNMGRAHDFSTFLAAAARLGHRDDLAYLFVGSGNQEPAIRAEAVRLGLEAMFRFQPYQPRERLAHSLSAPDVHLITLKPDVEGLIVPSKFYGVAAAGRPTIFVGDLDGEIASLVRTFDCGVSVSAGDEPALERAIAWLMSDRQRVATMGHNARQAFEDRFDRLRAMAEWEDAIAAITSETRRAPSTIPHAEAIRQKTRT